MVVKMKKNKVCVMLIITGICTLLLYCNDFRSQIKMTSQYFLDGCLLKYKDLNQIREIIKNKTTEKVKDIPIESIGNGSIDKQFTYEEIKDGNKITLYDKLGNVVYSVDYQYPTISWVKELTSDILEIGVSFGSPARYVFYFNKENAQMSDTYFNEILIDNQYVAYMEDNHTLILTDLFKEGIVYKKIVREFSVDANPIWSIINIELMDEEHILLEYYKGVQRQEEIEVITLEND